MWSHIVVKMLPNIRRGTLLIFLKCMPYRKQRLPGVRFIYYFGYCSGLFY